MSAKRKAKRPRPARPNRYEPRPVTHPAVRTIMATIDRAIASPDHDWRIDGGVVHTVAGMIIDYGNTGERFSYDWSTAAVRAVILAYAQHAPDTELQQLVRIAEHEFEWLEWWDREGSDEAHGIVKEEASHAAH